MFSETITALITFYETLSLAVATPYFAHNTALLFMDLRKVFDTVLHKVLLHRLYH